MQIFEFEELCNLGGKPEAERAKLICFYHYKETKECKFTANEISKIMTKFGFNAPNTSRLQNNLTKGKGKAFLLSKKDKSLEFIPAVLQELEREFGSTWDDNKTVKSGGILIDEEKFCGKRHYLDQLIKQINHSYESNCYDACAVIMRRLFEVLLILSYQNFNIDDEIKDKDGRGYVMLDSIIKNAENNCVLKLSRNKNAYITFQKVGNLSAHNITYIASKKDIDGIKINYRVMLEELYNKSGLID